MQSDGNSFCGDVVSETLTWHIQIKTAFYTMNMKIKYLGIFIIKIMNFKIDEENAYFKKIHNNTELINWVLVLLLYAFSYNKL